MPQNTSVLHRRRNLFIEKDFQFRFIVKFCLIVVACGLLTIAVLYSFSGSSTTVSVVDSRVAVRTTADFILPILIQTVAIVTIIASLATVAVTLLFSHRIAGPLFRFRKVIGVFSQGDFSSDFHIREADQLHQLAAELNEMGKNNQAKIRSIKEKLASLKQSASEFGDKGVSGEARVAWEKMKADIKELEEKVNIFKS